MSAAAVPRFDPAGDKRAWAALAPAGLVLVGAGTAVAGDASSRRAAGASALAWTAQGTAGLVLLGAGLSLFGEAVKRRARHDVAVALAGGGPAQSPAAGRSNAS